MLLNIRDITRTHENDTSALEKPEEMELSGSTTRYRDEEHYAFVWGLSMGRDGAPSPPVPSEHVG